MENAPRAICGCAFVFNASTPTNIAVKLHEEGGKHKVWLRNGPSMKSKARTISPRIECSSVVCVLREEKILYLLTVGST